PASVRRRRHHAQLGIHGWRDTARRLLESRRGHERPLRETGVPRTSAIRADGAAVHLSKRATLREADRESVMRGQRKHKDSVTAPDGYAFGINALLYSLTHSSAE